MRIELTPTRSSRQSKPKIEHVKSETHKWLSIRHVWEGAAKGLELQFESEDARDVKITLSKEDMARLILFVVENVIPSLVKEGSNN